jgi:hypothetical protein
MKNGARQMDSNCRALFVVFATLLLSATIARSDDNPGFRVAAIIFAAENSRVLVERADGQQSWFEPGDYIGDAEIVRIATDAITVRNGGRDIRMDLQGDVSVQSAAGGNTEAIVEPTEQLKSFQYLSLISRINAVDPAPGESVDRAVTRTMNNVLGLPDYSSITKIDRVKVSTPSQAQAELARRLSAGEPVRISIDDDERVLYITPDE